MPGIIKVMPQAGVANRGNILFAARMLRPQNKGPLSQPSGALMYMTPPLVQAGHGVMVSEAVTFSKNPFERTGEAASTTLTTLQREIKREDPAWIAFPVYDANANTVLKIAKGLQEAFPEKGLIFGGPFVTINPEVSAEIFGAFPNVIMVNGEAEHALPSALGHFHDNSATEAPGMFIRKGGILLGGDFATRVSLTPEEHESLSPELIFQQDVFGAQHGIELITSRGCFMGCSFCAASNALRSRHTVWSANKRIAEIERGLAWMREQGHVGMADIGIPDDNFFYNRTAGVEFLDAFGAHSVSREVNLSLQIGFASLFGRDGSVNTKLMDKMLRPDGTPFVKRLLVGIDYWGEEERARNKGSLEGQLTNEQIRNAIEELYKRRILLHTYWLSGDEQTTLTSFTKGLIFLAELCMDFGPYFSVDDPEPVELYTGVPMRQRILEAGTELPVVAEFGQGDRAVKFYAPLMPPVPIINYLLETIPFFKLSMGVSPMPLNADEILCIMQGLGGKWRDELMDATQRGLLDSFHAARLAGVSIEQCLATIPGLDQLPHRFRFLGKMQNFSLAELLELIELRQTVPPYYLKAPDFKAEKKRRNAGFDEAMRDLEARFPGQFALGDPMEMEPKPEVELVLGHPSSAREPVSRPKTVRRTSPKIGRNDPCPCGSGKKHKKCCRK